MITISQMDNIDDLFHQISEIERDLNAQFVGMKARITCDGYRTSYRRGSMRGTVLKGRWIEIQQVRVTREDIFIIGRLEDLQGNFVLDMRHPFKLEELEVV